LEDGSWEREIVWTRRFYKIDEWNPSLYKRLLADYEEHVDLIEDLALELTRAANYVCDKVREHVDPSFRLDDGALVLHFGPTLETLGWETLRPEYRGDERVAQPHPGLDEFKQVRSTRDFCFGASRDE
jgi:hypothetical protein